MIKNVVKTAAPLLSFLLIFSVLLHPRTSLAATSLVESLRKQGFRCSSKEAGTICVVNGINASQIRYSEPVAFLVPHGVSNPSNVMLHIHGWKGVCEAASTGPEAMETQFSLLNQIRSAGNTNGVMIFPLSRGQCETYSSELVPQFAGFISWVKATLQNDVTSWIISGHSGAGVIISRALANNPGFVPQVRSILLLDATYSISSHLHEWGKIAAASLRGSSPLSVFSVAIPGTSPGSGANTLASFLQGQGIYADANQPSIMNHCRIPAVDYQRLLVRSLNRK